MRPRGSIVALASLASLLLAACGAAASPTPPPSPDASAVRASVIPVIVSAEQVVGPNRFLFSFLDPDTNQPVASPERAVSVAFYAPGSEAGAPAATADGRFVWAIEGTRGMYVANATFERAGTWTAAFMTEAPGQPAETIRVRFDVRERGVTLRVGEAAPSVRTPTLDDVGGDVRRISSDKQPDPAFYTTSVDAALASHEPFVLVFATPAFCTSAQCGPTLERVKAVAKRLPGFLFINVEPYKLEVIDGRLQPVLSADGQLQPVEAVDKFGLLSEPWVFVVDSAGIIRGSFEGVFAEDELEAAIDLAK